MQVTICDIKAHTTTPDDLFIGRGPANQHMVSPNIKPGDLGWLGNPVVVNLPCPNCGYLHRNETSTLLCFATLFFTKLLKNKEFRDQMYLWLDFVQNQKQGQSLKLVCWCGSCDTQWDNAKSCHGIVIRDWLYGGACVIGFTRKMNVWAWMSNMSEHPVQYQGVMYKTAEHAYMCQKTTDSAEHEMIRDAATPEIAKRLGRTVTLRSDWEEVKVQTMAEIVAAKIETCLYLKDKLFETGNCDLIELTWWHDEFWGVCSCDKHKFGGRNVLGNIWMKLREKLRKEG